MTKRFGQVIANDAVTCDVAVEGIHAFLGENGAGKSTLMKVLSGLYQPDAGRVLIDGVPTQFHSPSEARRHGIGMVHQHLSLVPSMTVLDNILLGDERVPFLVNRRALARDVGSRAARLGFEFDLMATVSDLTLSDRQKVEIFKLLWRDTRVIILDEPTSQLAPFEAEEILRTMRRLALDGTAVLLVSHNIGEVVRFASRISVLTKGRCVATFSSDVVGLEELGRLMVGDVSFPATVKTSHRLSTPSIAISDVYVQASAIHRPLTNVSLTVQPGEILGVAGVAHSGQEEIAAILTGHLRPDRGTLAVGGASRDWDVLRQRQSCAAHIPADVRHEASIESLPLLTNLFLRDIFSSRVVAGPLLRRSAMREIAQERLASFDVQPADPQIPCAALSGGNLQRLVLARELAHDSTLLVAMNPTAGLDLAATSAIRAKLRAYANAGRSVVLISHDLQELLTIADRVVVLFNGEIVGTESTEALSAESVGLLMGGVRGEIVRAVVANAGSSRNGDARLRTALTALLGSDNRWQRHLGAQIGLRVFVPEDLPFIRGRMVSETYEETRIWLSLLLARLGSNADLDALIHAFALNPFGYVDAQRKILQAPDYRSMREALLSRRRNGVADWELVLGFLTVRHLDDAVAVGYGSAPSDPAAVLRSARLFYEDGVVIRP